MRTQDVIDAARERYPDEFTVNELLPCFGLVGRGVMVSSVKTEIRTKLDNLVKYGIVERRKERFTVYYRYVPSDSEAMG